MDEDGHESAPGIPMPGPNRAGYTETHHVHHDLESVHPISTTIVEALADIGGGEVEDVGFTLYDSIDTDALDQLFSPRYDGTISMNGRVSFTVENARVTVYSDGDIVIRIEPPRPR